MYTISSTEEKWCHDVFWSPLTAPSIIKQVPRCPNRHLWEMRVGKIGCCQDHCCSTFFVHWTDPPILISLVVLQSSSPYSWLARHLWSVVVHCYVISRQFLANWHVQVEGVGKSHIRNFIACCCVQWSALLGMGNPRLKIEYEDLLMDLPIKSTLSQVFVSWRREVQHTGPSVTNGHSFQEHIVWHSPDLRRSLLL
jgi:hypothetical protein